MCFLCFPVEVPGFAAYDVLGLHALPGVGIGNGVGTAEVLRTAPEDSRCSHDCSPEYSEAPHGGEEILRARGRVIADRTSLERADDESVDVDGNEEYLSEQFHGEYYRPLVMFIPAST